MLEALKLIGAVLGIAAFAWRIWDVATSYLSISLTVDLKSDGTLSALTQAENRLVFGKKIDNALLLIGPENEEPTDTFNLILQECGLPFSAKYTNDIASFKSEELLSGPLGRMFVPLPFYYSENIGVGDEKLSYRSPICSDNIPVGIPYSVRFIVGTHGRHHRSTHDSFVLG